MNISDRILYAQKLNTDAKRQVEVALCAADPVHFIDHWIWTLDPRELNHGRPAEIPMVLWPKQVEFVRWIQKMEAESKPGVCEKSRDAGATYCAIAYGVHGALFRPGFRCGFGSATEEDVDKIGDMKSIFERLRFMLRRIPRWMLEMCGIVEIEKCMSHRRFTNEARAAGVTGDCGDNIGRSDRTGLYFCDEAAQYIHPELVDTALSGTTNCRIDISTPKGQNAFYNRRMRFPPEQVFTMSWKDDPRKQETRVDVDGKTVNVFEEAKKLELGDPVLWAQEYGLDYSGSVENVCIPHEWVMAAVELDLPMSGPVCAGEDIAEEGKDRTVLGFRRGPVTTEILDWGQTTTFETAGKTVEECQSRGVACLNFDSVGVGCVDGATLISGVPVAELSSPTLVRTLAGRSLSTSGFRKGVADLYRVRTRSGRSVTVTAAHRFLTPTGWLPLSRLAVGLPIAADDSEDGDGCWGKPTSSLGRCSGYQRPCDERFRLRGCFSEGRGAPLDELTDVALDLLRVSFWNAPPSTGCFWDRLLHLGHVERRLIASVVYESFLDCTRTSVQELRWIHPRCKGAVLRPLAMAATSHSCHDQYESQPGEERAIRSRPKHRTRSRLSADDDAETMIAESFRRRTSYDECGAHFRPDMYGSLKWLQKASSFPNRTRLWDDIKSIRWIKYGEFYDIHVPIWENYSAAGLWHHNTGPKGIWQAMEESNTLGFVTNAINSGDSPTDIGWPDGRSSKEKFHNYRAEMWWLLRVRFERTWEYVTKGVEHPPEDMISIPNHSKLIAELSVPKRYYTDRMKIKIESKDEMRQRGVKSPDFADMLAMLYAPVMMEFEVSEVQKSQSVMLQLPKELKLEGEEESDPTFGPDYINMRF